MNRFSPAILKRTWLACFSVDWDARARLYPSQYDCTRRNTELIALDSNLLHQNKRGNTWQSVKLIAGMGLILGAIGMLLLGFWGAVGAILIALAITCFGPRVSPRVVLKMFKARRIEPSEAPDLYQIHNLLCQRAELEFLPPLYYIPSRMLNAFATGIGDRSAVAISDGLLRTLTPREMAGVLAHEISHIRHNDMRIMSLADSFSRFASMASRAGLLLFVAALFTGTWQGMWRLSFLFLAPILTALLQLALSRAREFNADMGAAELTRDPQGLASALSKLERMQPGSWMRKVLFPGNKTPEVTALRTHPPTAERIERLMTLVPQYRDQQNIVTSNERHALYSNHFERVRRHAGWHPTNGSWH